MTQVTDTVGKVRPLMEFSRSIKSTDMTGDGRLSEAWVRELETLSAARPRE